MTTQSKPVLTLSRTASGTISAHRFVTLAGAQAGAGGETLGVTRVAASSGDVIPVDVLGTTTVEAGAAVTAGDTLKADSSGRGITWATSGAKIGVALEAAAGAGSLIEVFLIPNCA